MYQCFNCSDFKEEAADCLFFFHAHAGGQTHGQSAKCSLLLSLRHAGKTIAMCVSFTVCVIFVLYGIRRRSLCLLPLGGEIQSQGQPLGGGGWGRMRFCLHVSGNALRPLSRVSPKHPIAEPLWAPQRVSDMKEDQKPKKILTGSSCFCPAGTNTWLC